MSTKTINLSLGFVARAAMLAVCFAGPMALAQEESADAPSERPRFEGMKLFEETCGDDVAKFCADVKKGPETIHCLMEKKKTEALSKDCTVLLNEKHPHHRKDKK